MLDKFWEAAGEKFADRWASVAAPAVFFWVGGALAWLWHDGGALNGLDHWARRQSEITQLVVLLAVLTCVAASGLLVQRLTAPVLRLAEGYWPPVLGRASGRRVGAVRNRAACLDERFQELAGPVDSGTATARQRSEFADVDQRLRRFPADGDYLPTRTGNVLRAAERRPGEKYGLDATVVWPRLWLLLPSDTRSEIAQARSALDAAVTAVIWAFFFLGFSFLAFWAPIITVGVIVVSCLYWIPGRAEVFADLVEAAFDVYRLAVYEQLRWPLPANPQEEHESGVRLTTYLLRGSDSPVPAFTRPAGRDKGEPAGGHHAP